MNQCLHSEGNLALTIKTVDAHNPLTCSAWPGTCSQVLLQHVPRCIGLHCNTAITKPQEEANTINKGSSIYITVQHNTRQLPETRYVCMD